MEGRTGLVRCDAAHLVRLHRTPAGNGLVVSDAGDHPPRVWPLGGLGIRRTRDRFEQRRHLYGTLPTLERMGYSAQPRRAGTLYLRTDAGPKPASHWLHHPLCSILFVFVYNAVYFCTSIAGEAEV